MGIVTESSGQSLLEIIRKEFSQAANRFFGLGEPITATLDTTAPLDVAAPDADQTVVQGNEPPAKEPLLVDVIGKRVDSSQPNRATVIDAKTLQNNPAYLEKARRGMSVFKAANGRYMFIAQYSNNLRDNDWFPEIIAGESHKRFVQLVEEGKAPLPELWLGHQPEYKVGECFAVAVDEVVLDEETGDSVVFALAFGFFDEGTERIAESIAAASPQTVAMSHGMPYDTISYWAWDMSIITQHETREVSVLDRDIAANRVTGFFTFTEVEDESKGRQVMAVDEFIRDRLINTLGVPATELDALEARNESIAEAAKTLYIERKAKGGKNKDDAAAADTSAANAETEAETDAATEQPVEQPAAETEPDPLDQPVTRGELVEVVSDVLAPLFEQLAAVAAKMNTVETNVKAMQQQQAEQAVEQLPRVTLQALIAENMKHRTVVGAPETRVDERTTLGKSAPREAVATADDLNLLNGMFG